MIPKIIHYCWFGKGPMPKSQRQCIRAWKKLMPDYQFMRWDENSFEVNICEFTTAAYQKKKYAYVADVARLFALSEFGGIYLDTDVDVFKRFDDFLKYDFFTGIEVYEDFYTDHIADKYLNPDGTAIDSSKDVPKFEVLTSTIGSSKGCGVIEKLKAFYLGIQVTPDMVKDFRKYVNYDRLVARFLTEYGFKYRDETQLLENNMIVFGTGTFGYMWCPKPEFEVTFHHNAMTWESENWTKHKRKEVFFDKYGLLGAYKLYKRVKNLLFHNNHTR